jgi:hypothetical protein
MQQQAEHPPRFGLNGKPDDKQLARPRYGHFLGLPPPTAIKRSPWSAAPPKWPGEYEAADACSVAVVSRTLIKRPLRPTTSAHDCPVQLRVARALPSELGFAGYVWTPERTGVQI